MNGGRADDRPPLVQSLWQFSVAAAGRGPLLLATYNLPSQQATTTREEHLPTFFQYNHSLLDLTPPRKRWRQAQRRSTRADRRHVTLCTMPPDNATKIVKNERKRHVIMVSKCDQNLFLDEFASHHSAASLR